MIAVPATPIISPIRISGTDWAPGIRRDLPTTPAERTSIAGAIMWRPVSSAIRPPATIYAAATWPLGGSIPHGTNTERQARNPSFATKAVVNVANVTQSHANAGRRRPATNATMKTTGSTSA